MNIFTKEEENQIIDMYKDNKSIDDIIDKQVTDLMSKYSIAGKKGSKAKNIDLKTFYGIMNRKIETNDLTKKEIETVIKDNYLLNKKYTEMRATYEKMEYSTDVKELLEEVGTLNKNNTVYKKDIKEITDIYGIDKKIVIELADKFSKEKENKNDKEIG